LTSATSDWKCQQS